jgi:hypothetical protein
MKTDPIRRLLPLAAVCVAPSNVDAIIGQWRAVHELGNAPDLTFVVDGYPRRVWLNADGIDVVEEYSITGMGHGAPLATRGAGSVGARGPFTLDVGISSTRHIARFWRLEPSPEAYQREKLQLAPAEAPVLANEANDATTKVEAPGDEADDQWAPRPSPGPAKGVRKIIEDALRTAGLMR